MIILINVLQTNLYFRSILSSRESTRNYYVMRDLISMVVLYRLTNNRLFLINFEPTILCKKEWQLLGLKKLMTVITTSNVFDLQKFIVTFLYKTLG